MGSPKWWMLILSTSSIRTEHWSTPKSTYQKDKEESEKEIKKQVIKVTMMFTNKKKLFYKHNDQFYQVLLKVDIKWDLVIVW